MKLDINKYKEQGFLHIENFIDPSVVNNILLEAKNIFFNQFIQKNYTSEAKIENIKKEKFNEYLFKIFKEDFEAFQNCGKQVQHLISLHQLSLSDKIVNCLSELGLTNPSISTRPVMFFNHPNLAKKKVYYKVDAHQDWRSMQGSLNSLVIWIPLMDINKELGALKIIPKSHLKGLVTSKIDHGFGMVEADSDDFIDVEVKIGDVLIFSSFLIHESGNNVSNEPRWSCHFRYNDLNEKSFIERGYPHAYLYRPVEELLTKNFPSLSQISKIFKI